MRAWRDRRRWRLVVAACVLTAGAALGGACGGDDDGGSSKKPIEWSAADENPTRFIERVAKLVETTTDKKDCGQLAEISARSYFRFDCPSKKAFRKSMAAFETVGVGEHGTGAVVDYKSGKVKDGAAILLFVAPDRKWSISQFGLVTEPSTETSDEQSREGYDRVLERYLTAVRERDCATFKKVAYTGNAGPKLVCRLPFARTEDLAARLKRNPSAKPRYEGGNATYGFYTLETQRPEPENSTISVVKSGEGDETTYIVLDVAPSPTAAQQRDVQRQYEQQQKNPQKPMGPSKDAKPSEPAIK